MSRCAGRSEGWVRRSRGKGWCTGVGAGEASRGATQRTCASLCAPRLRQLRTGEDRKSKGGHERNGPRGCKNHHGQPAPEFVSSVSRYRSVLENAVGTRHLLAQFDFNDPTLVIRKTDPASTVSRGCLATKPDSVQALAWLSSGTACRRMCRAYSALRMISPFALGCWRRLTICRTSGYSCAGSHAVAPTINERSAHFGRWWNNASGALEREMKKLKLLAPPCVATMLLCAQVPWVIHAQSVPSRPVDIPVRQGIEHHLDGDSLVVYLEFTATSPVVITIEPA